MTAPRDLLLACRCGATTGTLEATSPSSGSHAVCYCKDCQAFARLLGKPEILDGQGGTSLFQTSAGKVRLNGDHLACMRLTDKGPLRWYASCCDTPLSITAPTPALPFLSLLTNTLSTSDGSNVEDTVGPVLGVVNTDSALADAQGEKPKAYGLWRLIPRMAWTMTKARLRGDHNRSPFFDRQNGKPVAKPNRISAERRKAAHMPDGE